MTSIKSASTVLEPDNHHHHQQQQQQQPNDDDSSRTSKNEKYKITYNKKAESEFFVDNSALAGFTGERILYMAIRELLENALDSCESFSILPSITVSLKNFDQTNDLWELTCKDNGTGISSDKLPVAVCSFLTSAKYMEKQQRGLFGVGLKMVAAFSTKDTDYPVKVWNKSFNEAEEYYFELRTDIGTNRPIILKKKISTPQESQIESSSGFKIAVILRAKLVPITRNKIYEYVTETSIVNPYSSIIFETDDGVFQFDRRTSIMPQPAREILPHPSDMDLKTLKKAISKFHDQKISLPKILASSFQKLSYEKAKELVTKSGLELKSSNINFSEHDLIKIVNMCKKTKFQNPNTDHLSPIGQEILTIGMMSEYTIVTNKGNDASINSNSNTDDNVNPSLVNESSTQINNAGSGSGSQNTEITNSKTNLTFKNSSARSNFSVKVLKPVLTAYTSRTCVINNRPTIVETGLAYGGDIPSFKLYRFANKIPLLYDEGSDVAREVISEVQINKMGITKKQAKEQFSASKESKKDRAIEVLPLHIFFHVCSTKIPYKTAGKESIASEGELKYYMKSCLSELYRKLSTQIRKELKLKEAENKLRLYKHYLPFIVESINESLGIKNSKLSDSFSKLIENHLTKRTNMDELISSTGNSSSHIPSLVESDNIAVEEHTTKKMNNNNNNSNNSNSNSSGKGGSSNNNNSSSSHSHSGGNKDPKKFNGDIINTNNSNNNQKKKKKTREQKIELTKNFKSNTNNNKIKSYNAFDLKKHRDEIKKKSSNKKTTTPIPVKKSISTIHKHTEKTLKNSPKKNPEQTKTKTKDMQSIMSPYDKRVNKGKRK